MDIVVHGGAGSVPDDPPARAAELRQAAVAGSNKERPAEAVLAAITALERSPRFNAGVGGVVQSDGHIRTDAGIMTDTREVGAACAMPDVANAIAVADAVRQNTPHVLLAGQEAVSFAAAEGIAVDEDLWSERTRERWAEASLEGATVAEQRTAVNERYGDGHDTVGAVATDGERLVTGTSTGGRWLALAGRVGDVPQIGSGFFASPAGGASTTGAGEDIARLMLAREAVDRLEDGLSPDEAAASAIDFFTDRSPGNAGVILLTPAGEAGYAYSSDLMQTCHARDGHVMELVES